MNGADVRRWIAGFEAAAAADREVLRGQRPDSSWSINLALSMIAAAERTGWRAGDTRDEGDAEQVRRVWAILRQRLGR